MLSAGDDNRNLGLNIDKILSCSVSHRYLKESALITTCDASADPKRMPPPPLKFQRNSAKRAIASLKCMVAATKQGSLVTLDPNLHCLSLLDAITPADYWTISDLIDEVMLMTNFNE
jgi:hypothetical protein